MEKSGFQVNGVDRKGNDITIRCEGVDDKELAHFGGLDLHVKAKKCLLAILKMECLSQKKKEIMR